MRAELKHILSTSFDNLSDYSPEYEDNFSIFVQLIVGPANAEGEESFGVTICTPKWLIKNNKVSDIIVGRHYLIVFEYDYPRIYNKLKRLVEDTTGDTWEEIALKIGRIGMWEFEDYQESKG